jgi:hypothetical protein
LGDLACLMMPTNAEAYTASEKDGKVPDFFPAFNPWLYSLDTFLPTINFGQKDHWRPRDTGPHCPLPAATAAGLRRGSLTVLFPSSDYRRGS